MKSAQKTLYTVTLKEFDVSFRVAQVNAIVMQRTLLTALHHLPTLRTGVLLTLLTKQLPYNVRLSLFLTIALYPFFKLCVTILTSFFAATWYSSGFVLISRDFARVLTINLSTNYCLLFVVARLFLCKFHRLQAWQRKIGKSGGELLKKYVIFNAA